MRRWLLAALAAVFVFAGGVSLGQAHAQGTASPGSAGDPLVSESYVQAAITKALTPLETEIAKLKTGQAQTPPPASSSTAVAVVSLHPGQTVTGSAGTEFDVRVGRGKVQAGKKGGLSDVTAGKDLGQGVWAPNNHLLIASRSDGRGITARSNMLILVFGAYQVH